MIIGINYSQDGARTIAGLMYSAWWTKDNLIALANTYIEDFDEVYILDTFDPNDQPLLDEIVLNGCRIS